MSRLKKLLHVSTPSTGNTQQPMVHVCNGVAQHAHTTQQGCVIGVATITAKQEASIRAWLAHIEETDADIIGEIIDRCRHSRDARDYFLLRSVETSKPYPLSRNPN